MEKEKNLIVRIDEASVTLTEVSRFKNTSTTGEQATYRFTTIIESEARNELKNYLSKFADNKSFSNILVSWSDPNQFLVPMKLFQESNLESLSKVVFGEVAKNDLDYNRLPELNMVVIYKIPVWIKSAFVQLFPLAIIKAELAMFLRVISQKSTIHPKMYIRLFPNSVNFSLIGNSFSPNNEPVIFSNQYTFEAKEDILYFLLNILTKTKQSSHPKDIVVFNDTQDQKLNSKMLMELFNGVKTLKGINIESLDEKELAKIYEQCA